MTGVVHRGQGGLLGLQYRYVSENRDGVLDGPLRAASQNRAAGVSARLHGPVLACS